MTYVNITELIGKTIQHIEYNSILAEEIKFIISEEEKYRMYHDQSCCEQVNVEDIVGELDWLIGSPILRAEERTNHNEDDDISSTWTYYEIATLKGSVTIRWYGTSNCYYSESVNFERMEITK